MSHRKPLLWALALCLLIGAALIVAPRLRTPPPPASPEQEKHREDEAPKTTIELTPEQLEQAAIEVIRVPRRGARETVEVGGVIQPDPARTARVCARAAGRVVVLPVTIGARVRRGDTLAVLDSPDVAERRLHVRTAADQLALAERRLERERTLSTVQTETVGPVLEARLRRDRAKAEAERAERAWNRARSLYPEVVSRRDYEAARSEYDTTRAELRTAERALANEERVARGRVRVRAQTLQALSEVEAARADLRAAREALRVLGVGDGPTGEVSVPAPVAGVVTTRDATEGQWVEAGAPLFTLVDLSRVWAVVDIYEQDLKRVAVGQPVEVTSAAWPGRVFHGRLSFIHPMLEEHARTARGRVELPNPAALLRGEMFVRARIAVRDRIRAAAVPHAAVMEQDGRPYVYVEQAPGRFVRRELRLGASEGEWYEVLSGLKPGERIVAQGAFYLKSEQEKEQIGEDED